ncbi:MAG: helix-hairpin-helix domain-containing protein [Gammaproteobacteria bacterium]|nr:helix-hairpin-helix domain-containing protein [Gammaproteobacteria bacterium]MCY4277335.1 helix-hairpin-helix domain-containing protein [Gammaproteobacteria bacterium]
MHIYKPLIYSLLGAALCLGTTALSQTAMDTEATPPVIDERPSVDINSADASSLAEALDGVGLSRARAIIEWREANGPFEDPYDLVQVRGISERIVSLNETRIRIAGIDRYSDD